jgi:hypothetical protein
MKGLIVPLLLLASGTASANGSIFCEWPGGVQNVTNVSAATKAHYVGEPFVLSVTRAADWFLQVDNGQILNLGVQGAGAVGLPAQVPGPHHLRGFRPGEGYCSLFDVVLALPSVDSIGVSGTLWIASPIAFSASTSNGVDPKNYLWDFGDGKTSTSVAPTYAYNTAGTFTVTLTITDSNGRQGSRQQAVTIADNPNAPGQPTYISAEFLGCRANTARFAFEWAPTGIQPSNYYLYKIKPASTSVTTWTQLWLTRPMRIEPSLYNQHYLIEVSGCISNSAATCGPSRTRVLAAQNCVGGGVGSGR